MTLVAATMIILVIAMLAFEYARFISAREQLTSATDAASLAGAATLASSKLTDTTQSQTAAENACKQIFSQNEVFGMPLTDVVIYETTSPDPPPTPAVGQSVLTFRFRDPNNNLAIVPKGDPKGKVIEVEATFGYPPFTSAFLNLPNNVPLGTISQGGVPALDFVMVFDCSGSMDDETPVTFVKRRWDPAGTPVGGGAPGAIVYDIATGTAGAAEGRMKDVLSGAGEPNATPPELLSSAGGLVFDTALRGAVDSGTKPGNAPAPDGTDAPVGGASTYTDVVVNLDDQPHFNSFTSDSGFAFDTLGHLVEAARGNLSAANYTKSGANTTVSATTSDQFKDAYFSLARNSLRPMALAQKAAKEFFEIMNNDTDAHFAFVAFNNDIGADESSTSFTDIPRISFSYPQGGVCSPGLPMVTLPPPNGTETHFTNVKTAIDNCQPIAGTNIFAGVQKAVDLLKDKTLSRKSAKKAILLFTDGVATRPSGNGVPKAREAAQAAHDAGIPVFCIGLAFHPDVVAPQKAMLDDTPGSQGIADIAGNGSKFFQTTNSDELSLLFRKVAMELTRLIK